MNDYKQTIEDLRDEGFGLTADIIERLVNERNALAEELKRDIQKVEICGFPFSEVLKVMCVYSSTGDVPNKNYADGFMDGYAKAKNEFIKEMSKTVDLWAKD